MIAPTTPTMILSLRMKKIVRPRRDFGIGKVIRLVEVDEGEALKTKPPPKGGGFVASKRSLERQAYRSLEIARRAALSADLAEATERFGDVNARRAWRRMVQNVRCIHSDGQLLAFRQPEGLTHIGVEGIASDGFNVAWSDRSILSRVRVNQNQRG